MATEENTEEEAALTGRSQMHIHDAMVDWLQTEDGGGYPIEDMTAGEVIAAAFSRRVAWRKTDAYQEAKEAHATEAAEAKAARDAEREEAKAARAAAKAEKDAAKAAAKEAAAAAESEAEKPAAATTKKAAAKKAPATKKAASRRTGAKASGGEDPFA